MNLPSTLVPQYFLGLINFLVESTKHWLWNKILILVNFLILTKNVFMSFIIIDNSQRWQFTL